MKVINNIIINIKNKICIQITRLFKLSGEKTLLKLFLSLILCFCCLTATAEVQTPTAPKHKGIFSNFFQKVKERGESYKTQLETKYFEELFKTKSNDIKFLQSYAKFLEDHGYYDKAITIYYRMFILTKNKSYQDEANRIKALHMYNKQNKIFTSYIKQAQNYESKGKIPQANKYYLKAQKIFPKRFESMFGLAKTYGWLGKNSLANNYYKELLKIAPGNPDLIAAYSKFLQETKTAPSPKKPQPQIIQKELQKANPPSPAPQVLQPAKPSVNQVAKPSVGIISEKSKLFDNYIKQAQDYEKQGKVSESNEYYLKAQKIDSSRFEVKFGLAKTYGWMHNDRLAIKYYKELLKQTPENIDLLAAYASYLKDTKEYAQAMEIYQKLLERTKDEKYNVNIAEIYFLQQDYKTSMSMYQELYEKNPTNPDIQKAIALLYFVSGDFENAICFYGKYLAQKHDPESILNYAKSLFYTKRVQAAKQILETYVKIYPENAEGLSALADIYLSENCLCNAMELLNKAMAIEPDNIKYKIQYARVEIAAKNYLQAQSLLLCLLKMEPDNPDILENLGDISYYTNDFNQALMYYQCIPDFENKKKIRFKIAQTHHYRKDYILAEKLYWPFLCDPEYSTRAKIGIAEIRISQNKPLEARKILENVLANNPEDVQAEKNLAITYFSTGDNYKSIKILETLPQDDTDVTYNLAKAYNKIERNDTALELLENNPQENAQTLRGEIKMQVKPAIAPMYEAYYEAPSNGSANAGKYQKAGGAIYLYIKPNLRAVLTSMAAQYSNITNLVSTTAIINTAGLEGQLTNHLGFRSSFGVESFSNGESIFLGSAIARYTPNDYISWTSGYIRSLDEIDSYMSAAGVVPSVGPFANQLVGRIIDNKYMLFNIGLKLPYKSYAYGGMNVGNKYGNNSASNFYKEIMWGLGKLFYSAAENRPINQALFGYDFYYTGYNEDMSGFGGANLDFSPIGSDGQPVTPFSGFPGTGGYFSPTFFIANKFPLTIKGSFRETKLKYVLSGYIGTQTIQGQVGLLGGSPTGRSSFVTVPYFGYSVGIVYNEKGRVGWGFYYSFNNYMSVAQHLLRANLLVRF